MPSAPLSSSGGGTTMGASLKQKTGSITQAAEIGGSLKQVQQAFSAFQIARNQFVNALSGFLEKKDSGNVTLEALMKNDVMAVLCCPLAQDAVPGIQSLSLQCLGRLAESDPLLSQVVVSCGVLDSIVISLSHENPPVQASANQVLTAVAKSTADFAARVLAAGVLPHLTRQLQSGTPLVKESAVHTINALTQSSPQHAALICDDALLSLLVALLLVKDSPHSLLKALVLCLSNVAAGGAKLAEALMRVKGVEPLTMMVRGQNTPPDLKALALNALAQVCRHHDELANQVANSGVLHSAVACLTDKMTPAIRRNAAALLLQVTQKTPDLADVVVKAGAPAALQKYLVLEESNKEGVLKGIMIIGTMSSYRALMAKAVVDAGAGEPVIAHIRSPDLDTVGTAAWAVEQMAQHTDESAGPLIAAGALQSLLEIMPRIPAAHADVARKVKLSTKALIRNAATSGSLEPFVDKSTPKNILSHVLRKLEVLLAKSPKGRQSFVTSGALLRLLSLKKGLPHKAIEPANSIFSLFPEDVIKYYKG